MPNASADSITTFPQINLKVGQVVQLVARDTTNKKYLSQIHGYVENDCILVQIPKIKGQRVPIIIGEWFDVRLVVGLSLLEFECRALKLLQQPHGTMLLSYPQQLHKTQLKRSFERIKVDLPAIVLKHGQSKKPLSACFFNNISAKGGALVAPSVLGAEGETIQIELQFTLNSINVQEKMIIDAVIRKASPLSKEETGAEHHVHSVEFDHVDARIQLLVYELLWNRQA